MVKLKVIAFNLARVIGGSETDICIGDADGSRTNRATFGTQGFGQV